LSGYVWRGKRTLIDLNEKIITERPSLRPDLAHLAEDGSAKADVKPGYSRARAMPGILARLSSEDWSEMTRAANASSRHVRSLDRWVEKARAANPALSDEQAERLAVTLRREHYQRMGRLSGQARKGEAVVTVSRKHPAGRIMLEAARQQGWDVSNVSEAEVACQLGALGYTSRDVETQFRLGPYRLDFAIPAARIDIEADGWVHGAASVQRQDAERDRRIGEWGWTVARIDTESGDVRAQLRRHLPDRSAVS